MIKFLKHLFNLNALLKENNKLKESNENLKNDIEALRFYRKCEEICDELKIEITKNYLTIRPYTLKISTEEYTFYNIESLHKTLEIIQYYDKNKRHLK